jgi:site-specific DNA recombinase
MQPVNNTGRAVEIVRASSYTRTSTGRQEKEGTIESQKEQVYDYVRKNYPYIKEDDIIMFKDEGWTGSNIERPGMEELLESLKDDTWDVLVVPDPDRLARDPYLQLFILEEVEKAGKEIKFCSVDSPDSNDAEQLIMFEFRGMMSKYEKVRINSRFRAGKMRKAKKHIMLSVAPYGYDLIKRFTDPVTGVVTETHIVVNDKEASIIKLIFDWYIYDNYSMREICHKLKSIGAKPRKNKSGDWNTSTIGNILKNETYIGNAYYRRTEAIEPEKPIRKFKDVRRNDKKTSRKMRPEEQWMKVSVPSIIEPELFDLAQEQRKKNAKMSARNKKNNYLLAGKIYCTCGAARTGEGPQKGRYLYYRCGGRHNNQTTGCRKCELTGVDARIADGAVWDILLTLLTERAFLRNQLKMFYKNKNGGEKYELVIKEAEEKLAAIEKRIVELKQFVLEDKLPVSQYIELQSEAEKQSMQYKKEKAEAVKKIKTDSKNLITEGEFELVLDESFTQLNNLNFKGKRAIVEQLIDEVVGEPGKLTVTGYIGVSSSSETQELEGSNYSSNSSENHVKHKTIGGNCWAAERREIDAL